MEAPGPGDTVVQGDLEEIPVVTDLGWDTQDLEDQSPQQSLPSHPKAGELFLSPFGVILLEGVGVALAVTAQLGSRPQA